MQMYNQQGITENYPQYGTNFWGDAGNNYGFGSSNISQNIQKMTDAFNNGNFAGSFTDYYANGTNGFSSNGSSFAGNGNSFGSGSSFGSNNTNSNRYSWSSGYSTTPTTQTRTPTPWSPTAVPTYTTQTPWQNNQTLTPWNGGYDLSRYPQSNTVNQQIGKTPDFSTLRDMPLYMGLTSQPEQAHLRGLDTSLIQNRAIVNSPYSNNILENDCYQSPRFEPFAKQVRWNEGEKQGVIYATPQKHGTDQPTMYGISQGSLDLYRRKFKDIAHTYPANVKNLTEDQAMNLLCQYYKGSRAEAINDPNLAFSVYDSYFNSPKNAPIAWQQTLKNEVNPDISIGGGIGSQTLNGFNSVKSDTELLNTFIENRKNTLDKKYKKGLINRFRSYPIK